MPAKKSHPKTPTLRHHKASGRAFVEIEKRRIYLGKYGSAEATRAYHAKISEWVTSGFRLPISQDDVTLTEICDAYLQHCDEYYRDSAGNPTTTLGENSTCIRAVLALYSDIRAVDFGPLALRAVRQTWIDRGLAISTINSYTNSVRGMFKWATSHQMVPPETLTALQSVTGLRRGRGVGKDTKPRQVVPMADVEATMERLPSPLRAVVRLLLLTGARPTEILQLKRGDVDCTGDVWVAIIREHKLSYRGVTRTLYFGPRAQGVLRPFLLRTDDQYLFSPKEAVAESRKAQRKSHGRRPNQKPNPRRTERVVSDCYEHRAANKAIKRVCDDHGITPWTPYRLRHTAATMIEASADVETARAILGHADLDTTAIYLHRDSKTAVAWASTHG